MWEKDKKLIAAFRECYANMHQSLADGEDIDITSTCVEETEALTAYTVKMIDLYKNSHPSEMSEKKQRYYNPKVPYFQNL